MTPSCNNLLSGYLLVAEISIPITSHMLWWELIQGAKLESLFSAHGRYFSPSNLRARKNHLCIALNYSKHLFQFETLKTLYTSIIEPHFRYCCSVWGCCGKTEIDRLQKLQNWAARIITNSSYDAPSLPQIHSLGWETIDDLINQEIRTITFKSVNKLAPQYLIDLFTRNSNLSHNLRNTDSDVQIPKKKPQMDRNASCIGVLKFGIVYQGMQKRHLP